MKYKIKNIECAKCTTKIEITEINKTYKNDFIYTAILLTIFIIFLIRKFTYQCDDLLCKNISFAAFFIIYILSGWKVLFKAFINLKRAVIFDENFLMLIASVGAIVIGAVEEAAALMLFFKIGSIFEEMSVLKSRKSINELLNIRPDYANVINESGEIKKDPANVEIGSTIIVRPTEKIPLDGTIITGSSLIDTSALTGESIPKNVNINDNVMAGMINKTGVLTIKTTKIFSETSISKIQNLIENATHQKANTEMFFTTFARFYTPIVVSLALFIAFIMPMIFPTDEDYKAWLYKALVLLVISCPCSLVVSIPLAYFGSIGYASKKGILIKGSKFIDYLDNVKSVFFDKTGTLTKGTFKLTKIVPATGFNEEQLLNLAIIAETHSNHPIAISIKEKKETTENKNDITDYKELAGKGVSVKYNDKHILAGNVYLLRENKVAFKEANEIGTVVYIAINNFYAGYLVVSDQIKPEANKTMKMLKEKGVKEIIILTGDKNTITEKYATELKIDRYFAELLPEDKISIFNKELQKKTKKESYIFVGDGINDAPAIALADVGIAMGNIGTDAAIETADVVIMNDNISLLIDLLQIAKKNKKIIIQNIIISLFVKIFFIMLGIFGDATIWEAVFADVGVTILVIFNAKRVLLS